MQQLLPKEIDAALNHVRNDRFHKVPHALWGEKRFVLEAVNQNGRSFACASNELKKDKQFVLEAIKLNRKALEYASSELQNDEQVVLEAVKKDGRTLQYASNELQNDQRIVLEAVHQDGRALKYASNELNNDKLVVLEAVKQNGMALKYASNEFQNDKLVVLEAVKQNEWSLQYASNGLQNDKQFMLEVVKQNGWVKSKLFNDDQFTLGVFGQYGEYREKWLRNVTVNDIDEYVATFSTMYFGNNAEMLRGLYSRNQVKMTSFLIFNFSYKKDRIMEWYFLKLFAKFKEYANENTIRDENYLIMSDTLLSIVDGYNKSSIHYKDIEKEISSLPSFDEQFMTIEQLQSIGKLMYDWMKIDGFPFFPSIQSLLQSNSQLNNRAATECRKLRTIPFLNGYHFIGIIGQGGQGTVYSVIHPTLGHVALKINKETIDFEPEKMTKRYEALKSMNFERVIKYYECGVHEYNDNTWSYFVMELGGRTLLDEIPTNMSVFEKEDVIHKLNLSILLLESVCEIHSKGWMHRDVDPSNFIIFEDQFGNIILKAIDLDMARSVSYLKTVTMNIGKYKYMAPEALSADGDDTAQVNTNIFGALDLFSIGCTIMRLFGMDIMVEPKY